MDAGMDEAPGKGVLYMISPSSSMAAGSKGGQGRERRGRDKCMGEGCPAALPTGVILSAVHRPV